MRIFGLDIRVERVKKALQSLRANAGSWQTIFDWAPGAWQQHSAYTQADFSTISANWALFSCVTLIANDISKMPAAVMQFVKALKIFEPTLLRPVLRKPNHYQTRIEFFKSWLFSLLLRGNTYVLKQRDEKGFIVALYILDPCKVTPMVDEEGGVWYQLGEDNMAGGELRNTVTVPASEIIHDRLYTLWHPLIGVSPIYACGMAAMQSSAIQNNSEKFFANMSRPSGILTAPGAISNETATRLKTAWEENFSGDNIGKVAVLGDALKYEAMTITATDAQLIEQLKFTGEMVCATFHVPPYKLGLGQMPTVNNVAALNQQYYEQALQPIVENIELRLHEGLELNPGMFEVWLDETVMLRMDPVARMESHTKAISGALLAPNEARRMENWAPQKGGDVLYLQQQNFSLPALAKRDAKEDPFGKGEAPAAPAPAATEPSDEDAEAEEKLFAALLTKELAA